VVIVALGANDGLRGLPVAQLRENLSAIVAIALSNSKAQVLLVGQRIPPNYGAYADLNSTTVFRRRGHGPARPHWWTSCSRGWRPEHKIFQADNLHPTAAAQPLLLDNVWRGLSATAKIAGCLSHRTCAACRQAYETRYRDRRTARRTLFV
jgi:acyl-CoA thioesterase-1